MKMPLCFFVLLLLRMQNVYAQENGSLLYEISGNGLPGKSYVFGTIHLRDKRVFEQVSNKKDSLWFCFKHSDIIAGELKFDKAELKEEVMDKVLLPDGVSLSSLLSPDDYANVKAYAKEQLGWKALLVDRIKPLFTITLLTESMTKADYKNPLDVFLQEEGEKKKKEIAGIETIDEQMQALGSMSLDEQAKELVEFVKAPHEGEQELEKMINLYRERKLMDLYTLIINSEMSDSVETALLTDRNKLMAFRIEGMMLRKPVFAAVGAAHLPGEQGVLNLLRRKGYTIRAVDARKKIKK